MTIDQIDSRRHGDAVPQLLGLLRDVPVVLPFERTAGDEVQGVLSDACAVTAAWEVVCRAGQWSVGIGIGGDGELAGSSRASRGGPFLAARDAVEEAKGEASRVSVELTPAADADAQAIGGDAQAVLRLLATIVDLRSDAGWRVIDAARARPDATQSELARDLGISRQAVSKALRSNHLDVVDDGLRAGARLLERALALCPPARGAAPRRGSPDRAENGQARSGEGS